VDDLVQTTLLRAHASGAVPERVEAFTIKIARDAATDAARATRIRGVVDAGPYEGGDGPTLEECHAPSDHDPIDVQSYLALIGRLSPRSQQILLAVSERVPQGEIARELGVSPQAVRNDLHRARKTFARMLAARDRTSRRTVPRLQRPRRSR
jgi:RNA polymerase sigma factor (sigma-70 family)